MTKLNELKLDKIKSLKKEIEKVRSIEQLEVDKSEIIEKISTLLSYVEKSNKCINEYKENFELFKELNTQYYYIEYKETNLLEYTIMILNSMIVNCCVFNRGTCAITSKFFTEYNSELDKKKEKETNIIKEMESKERNENLINQFIKIEKDFDKIKKGLILSEISKVFDVIVKRLKYQRDINILKAEIGKTKKYVKFKQLTSWDLEDAFNIKFDETEIEKLNNGNIKVYNESVWELSKRWKEEALNRSK